MKSNIVHYQRFKQFKFLSLFSEGFCIFTDSVYIIYLKPFLLQKVEQCVINKFILLYTVKDNFREGLSKQFLGSYLLFFELSMVSERLYQLHVMMIKSYAFFCSEKKY